MSAGLPATRATASNAQGCMPTPACAIAREAARSELPWGIVNSTVAAPSLRGVCANHQSQPPAASIARIPSRNRDLSVRNIRMGGAVIAAPPI
jgi:hypothetical protein